MQEYAELKQLGAHFVLCGSDKRPRRDENGSRAWKHRQVTAEQISAHVERGGLPVITPQSVAQVCIDIDVGGSAMIDRLADLFNSPPTPLGSIKRKVVAGFDITFTKRPRAVKGARNDAMFAALNSVLSRRINRRMLHPDKFGGFMSVGRWFNEGLRPPSPQAEVEAAALKVFGRVINNFH